MVRIAARPRPSLAGALLLTGIAALPWVDQHQHRVGETVFDVVTRSGDARPDPRDRIVLTPWDRVELGPQHFEVLVPPKHPDAQDWPRGMVIGRYAPPVDPGILRWAEPPLANVMSVFLAPWAVLGLQLGT